MLTLNKLTIKTDRYQPARPPSGYPGEFDLTGHIGPLFNTTDDSQWPMYSFDRPAMIVWQAIGQVMHDAGWSDKRIRDWLQSRNARWSLDSSLGDGLREFATKWASELIAEGKK